MDCNESTPLLWRCWKPKERFSLCSELSTRSSAARGRRLLQRTAWNSTTRTLGELGQEGEDTARRLCENVQEGEGPALVAEPSPSA
jgi:hypothetical protein